MPGQRLDALRKTHSIEMACLAVYTIFSIGASFVNRANTFKVLVLHTKLASVLRKTAFPMLPDKVDGFVADGLASKRLLQSNVLSKVCKAQQPRHYQSMAVQTLSQQQGQQPLSNCCLATVNSMPLGENA